MKRREHTHRWSAHFKSVTEETCGPEEVIHVHHEEGVEYGIGKFDMAEMAWAGEVVQVACRAPGSIECRM